MPGLEAISGLGSALGALAPQGVAGVAGPGSVGLPGSIGGVGGQGVRPSDGIGGAAPAGGGFAATLLGQLENVQALRANSSDLAVKAATGDLTDVHDYTIAATQAKVATEVTVAVRNKGLEAFNDIMRMQV